MESNFTDEDLAALLKSVEITKRDAEFNAGNQPKLILHPARMLFLKETYLKFDPKLAFNKILSIESNRKVLKRDLKKIVYLIGECLKNPKAEAALRCALKKYNIEWVSENPSANMLSLGEVFIIFPDIVYNVSKENGNNVVAPTKNADEMIKIYQNFKPIYLNIGILGLLPKGKKYGGFVKALIHITVKGLAFIFSEEYLAFCRCIYHSTITPHDKREKWFSKLEIKDSDCVSWTKIFDMFYPEHTDIHKYFGQIA